MKNNWIEPSKADCKKKQFLEKIKKVQINGVRKKRKLKIVSWLHFVVCLFVLFGRKFLTLPKKQQDEKVILLKYSCKVLISTFRIRKFIKITILKFATFSIKILSFSIKFILFAILMSSLDINHQNHNFLKQQKKLSSKNK